MSNNIDYKVENLKNSEVEITITIPKEELKKHEEKAIEDVSKGMKIKGFRPGHAPREVIEKYVASSYIDNQAQELAIQMAYAKVVKEEKIKVISRPKMEIVEKIPLKVKLKVAVLPEIEFDNYKDIKIKKEDVKADKKDIEKVLDDLKKKGRTYKDVERAAKKGDRVEIDFEGFDEEGKEIEGTKSKNHPVILGEGTLIPGFEEKVEGMKNGEEKEFDITFPKDYGKEDFRNKKVKFKIKLNRIEEAVEPELNEAYIEKITGKKMTVEELEKDIEKNIKLQKEEENKSKRENAYIEELLKKAKMDIPSILIEEEIDSIVHELKHDVTKQQLTWEQFLEQAKTTEEKLKEKYKGEAEKRIKIRMVLQKLIEIEGVKIDEKELREEIDKIKLYYPVDQHAKIEKDFKDGELGNQVASRLLLRKLFEKVLN